MNEASDSKFVAIYGIQVAFKNFPPFTKCITRTDGTTADDAEDLDLVMPMYDLLEYSSNYSDTTGSVWFNYKDEASNFNNDIVNNNNFKSFKYKVKLLGNTVAQLAPNQANGILKTTTIYVASKYPSNFWRSLEMALINYKAELKLRWTKHCVLSVLGNENDNDNADSNNVIFTIKDTKLSASVIILSAKDNKKLSKLLSKRFERSVCWN